MLLPLPATNEQANDAADEVRDSGHPPLEPVTETLSGCGRGCRRRRSRGRDQDTDDEDTEATAGAERDGCG